MAQIRWTEQAAKDLEAITEFIAADSEYYAQLPKRDTKKTAAGRHGTNGGLRSVAAVLIRAY